jgi:hypothetical protein
MLSIRAGDGGFQLSGAGTPTRRGPISSSVAGAASSSVDGLSGSAMETIAPSSHRNKIMTGQTVVADQGLLNRTVLTRKA